MSTKTTFKRIALVAVAALGFGVLSVVPSQATVTGTTVTVVKNGTAATAAADSTTAAVFTVSGLVDNVSDTITVSMVLKSKPTTGTDTAHLFLMETTTSVNSLVTKTIGSPTAATPLAASESLSAGAAVPFGIHSATPSYVGARFGVQLDSATGTTLVAGTYTYTIIVKSSSAGAHGTPVTQTADVSVVVAAAAVKVPAAANAKAVLEAGDPASVTSVIDSVTSGSFVANTTIGKIKVSNFSSDDTAVADTVTVSMTGVGYLTDGTTTGRSFVIAPANTVTLSVKADGTSGTGTITITTAAGASFVKTVTFFDTKPTTATAVVAKAFIKAGATTSDVFAITVKDGLGNAISQGGVTVTAAPTDTATTVGGAATCAWNVKGAAYHCSVTGKAADKFGPVAYTITATGTGLNIATKVTTSATVTFADNIATKAVLAGPATGTPGATVEYTLTLTEKNGYPVADMIYGAGAEATGGDIFSATAADRVVSGWSGNGPFVETDSFTSKSGVLTSKGVLPIAGVASLSVTLVGDGISTAAGDAIDKTIGETVLTASTDVANPGVDAATDAANEATDAANAATDAALAAAEAADAATSAAQEASDAVAALSETVTQLIAGLQAQIKSLAAVVARIAKQTKK